VQPGIRLCCPLVVAMHRRGKSRRSSVGMAGGAAAKHALHLKTALPKPISVCLDGVCAPETSSLVDVRGGKKTKNKTLKGHTAKWSHRHAGRPPRAWWWSRQCSWWSSLLPRCRRRERPSSTGYAPYSFSCVLPPFLPAALERTKEGGFEPPPCGGSAAPASANACV
jgi:hypothetical protein